MGIARQLHLVIMHASPFLFDEYTREPKSTMHHITFKGCDRPVREIFLSSDTGSGKEAEGIAREAMYGGGDFADSFPPEPVQAHLPQRRQILRSMAPENYAAVFAQCLIPNVVQTVFDGVPLAAQ